MRKYISLFLIFAFLAAPAMAQMSSRQYLAGKMDGERDATGNQAWILGGCLLGVIGVILAYVIEPEVPAARLMGKSPSYIQGYTEGYKSATKRKNVMYALYGMAAWLGFVVIYMAASGH